MDILKELESLKKSYENVMRFFPESPICNSSIQFINTYINNYSLYEPSLTKIHNIVGGGIMDVMTVLGVIMSDCAVEFGRKVTSELEAKTTSFETNFNKETFTTWLINLYGDFIQKQFKEKLGIDNYPKDFEYIRVTVEPIIGEMLKNM